MSIIWILATLAIIGALIGSTVALAVVAREAKADLRTARRQMGIQHNYGEPSDSPDQESDGT